MFEQYKRVLELYLFSNDFQCRYIGAAISNSYSTYGSWGYIRHHYSYLCSGSELTLSSCSTTSNYHCYTYQNAGVRCVSSIGMFIVNIIIIFSIIKVHVHQMVH